MPDLDGHQVDCIEDEARRLTRLSCHPLLTAESRAALTLPLVGGRTTAEIARAFWPPNPQRASGSREPRRRCPRLTLTSSSRLLGASDAYRVLVHAQIARDLRDRLPRLLDDPDRSPHGISDRGT